MSGSSRRERRPVRWGPPTEGARRFAFRFTPAVVRAILPPAWPGTYLLLSADGELAEGRVVYVGRSDVCVRTRLASHELLGHASHFTVETATSPRSAYLVESYWYHQLADVAQRLNRIHPAAAVETGIDCPFCCGVRVRTHKMLADEITTLEVQ